MFIIYEQMASALYGKGLSIKDVRNQGFVQYGQVGRPGGFL